MKIARKYNISIKSTQVFKHASNDMSEAIRGLKASKCRGAVVFSTTTDLVELLLESEKQNLDVVWFTGDPISAQYSEALRSIEKRGSKPLEVLRGVFAFTLRHGRGLPRYKQFVRDWCVKS